MADCKLCVHNAVCELWCSQESQTASCYSTDENKCSYYNGWIPVTERLPEKDGDYLVFKRSHFGGWCRVASFAKDGAEVDEYDLGGCENVWYDYDSEYGYISFDSVTHWMPLPEPPKENADEM